MEGMTGIEVARRIRETDHDTLIIFLTTSGDFVFKSFNVHAYHYILKPMNPSDLKEPVFNVLDEIVKKISIPINKLFFTFNKHEYSIPYQHSIFVQSNNHNMLITDRYNNQYRPRMTYSEIHRVLETDNRFLQINRGILINMDYITDFANGICVLDDKYRLPVSVRERKTSVWRQPSFRPLSVWCWPLCCISPYPDMALI